MIYRHGCPVGHYGSDRARCLRVTFRENTDHLAYADLFEVRRIWVSGTTVGHNHLLEPVREAAKALPASFCCRLVLTIPFDTQIVGAHTRPQGSIRIVMLHHRRGHLAHHDLDPEDDIGER